MNIKSKIQTNSAYILIIILIEFVLSLLIINPGTIITDIFDNCGLYMDPTISSTAEDIQKIASNNFWLFEIEGIIIKIYQLIILVLFSLAGYLCIKYLPLPDKIKFRYLPLFIPFLLLFLLVFLSIIVNLFSFGGVIAMILPFLIIASMLTAIGYLLAKNIPFKNNILKKFFPFIFPTIYTLINYVILNVNIENLEMLPIFYARENTFFSYEGLNAYPIILYSAFAISFIIFDRFRIRREKNKHQLI